MNTNIWLEVIALVALYITGIIFYIEVIKNIKELTPKIARRSLIWPILLIMTCINWLLYVVNGVLVFLFMLVGFNYNNTKMHQTINKIKF